MTECYLLIANHVPTGVRYIFGSTHCNPQQLLEGLKLLDEDGVPIDITDLNIKFQKVYLNGCNIESLEDNH